MGDIKLLIETAVKLLNTRLTFEPFSFTVMHALLGTVCLAIVIGFVLDLFDV